MGGVVGVEQIQLSMLISPYCTCRERILGGLARRYATLASSLAFGRHLTEQTTTWRLPAVPGLALQQAT